MNAWIGRYLSKDGSCFILLWNDILNKRFKSTTKEIRKQYYCKTSYADFEARPEKKIWP